jgi:hypothetical protein
VNRVRIVTIDRISKVALKYSPVIVSVGSFIAFEKAKNHPAAITSIPNMTESISIRIRRTAIPLSCLLMTILRGFIGFSV